MKTSKFLTSLGLALTLTGCGQTDKTYSGNLPLQGWSKPSVDSPNWRFIFDNDKLEERNHDPYAILYVAEKQDFSNNPQIGKNYFVQTDRNGRVTNFYEVGK